MRRLRSVKEGGCRLQDRGLELHRSAAVSLSAEERSENTKVHGPDLFPCALRTVNILSDTEAGTVCYRLCDSDFILTPEGRK